MQLVRQIQFKQTPLLDEITFRSKNLFNVATYTVRKRFFEDRHWIRYYALWKILRSHEAYTILHKMCGSHPPQQVLKQVDRNFKSFFQAIKEWKKHPERFQGRPNLPRYKRKNGHNLLIFTSLQCRLKNGQVLLTRKMEKLGFPCIPSNLEKIKGVCIVPFGDRYNIEFIYNYEEKDLHLEKNNVMGIDLGLINIVTSSDNIGGKPLIIKGGVLKSINQYYNKQLSNYKSIAKKCNDSHITNRILKFHRKRNNKVSDFFHKTSRKIITHCINHNIGTIVIGYNEGVRQEAV